MTLERGLQVLAAVLTIGSAMLAVAANTPALGLSEAGIGFLAVIQAGVSAALAFLPRIPLPTGKPSEERRV